VVFPSFAYALARLHSPMLSFDSFRAALFRIRKIHRHSNLFIHFWIRTLGPPHFWQRSPPPPFLSYGSFGSFLEVRLVNISQPCPVLSFPPFFALRQILPLIFYSMQPALSTLLLLLSPCFPNKIPHVAPISRSVPSLYITNTPLRSAHRPDFS